MSIKLEQKFHEKKSALALIDGKVPLSIKIQPGSPGVIQFSDNTESAGACISCPDQPCIRYAEDDRDKNLMSMFKIDQTSAVCAVSAIQWSDTSNQPVINPDSCIACGVCAARCPTKAIYLEINTAKVSVGSSKFYQSSDVSAHLMSRAELSGAKIDGIYFEESDQFISHFTQRTKSLGGRGGSINPNLLVRNLLRTLGVHAEAYAQGVQYNTVDVVFKIGNLIGAGEVETSNATIDVPRNLAGIVAFLVSRNKIDANNILPFSFIFKLPQGREQYWMVVDDMKKVLDLEICTLSLLSLCLLVWSRVMLKLPDKKLTLSEKNGTSLRPFLEHSIKRKLYVSEGIENQFEPSKIIG